MCEEQSDSEPNDLLIYDSKVLSVKWFHIYLFRMSMMNQYKYSNAFVAITIPVVQIFLYFKQISI